MAVSENQWVREYNEAVKLADDITKMILERSSLPGTGPDAQRYSSTLRRKITILGTRLDTLQSHLSKLPGQQPLTQKEMNRHKDMVVNLRSKNVPNGFHIEYVELCKKKKDSLLGPEIKPADAMSRTTGLDNFGNFSSSKTNHEKQDEDLEKLEETVISTKHVALAINEELDLHGRLIVDLDEHIELAYFYLLLELS